MKIDPENQPIFRVLSVLRLPLAVLAALVLVCTVVHEIHISGRPEAPVLAAAEPEGTAMRIDINTADADTLALLPGIGPTLAERIIEMREADGPFASPDDLTNVKGIGEGKLSDILPYITCGAQ